MLELGLLCGIIKCMHLNNFSNSLTMTSGNSDSDSPTVTSVVTGTLFSLFNFAKQWSRCVRKYVLFATVSVR